MEEQATKEQAKSSDNQSKNSSSQEQQNKPKTPFNRFEKLEHLVIDSGGFIRGLQSGLLSKIANGNSDESKVLVYTIPEVLAEVRDRNARDNLNFLFPSDIKLRDPHPDDVKKVIEFAKKTGDFSNLSPVDLKLLSLAYTIEREVYGSANHLRTEPKRNVAVLDFATKVNKKKAPSPSSPSHDSKPHTHPHNSSESTSHLNQNNANGNDNNISPPTHEHSEVSDSKETIQSVINLPEKASSESPKEIPSSHKEIQITNEPTKAEEDEEDEEGWITPENIEEVTEKLTKQKKSAFAKNKKKVGTITTDYAMQNVMLQMGLNLITVDGMRIRNIRQYVMKCHTCFKISKDMSKVFCPQCGNNTLIKISIQVDEKGNITHIQNTRRQLNLRGTKFPIPLPKGGRNNNDLILTEDQYVDAMKKKRRQMKKNAIDISDPEFDFATEKAGKHVGVVVGYGNKNPNIPRTKVGKKNKSKNHV